MKSSSTIPLLAFLVIVLVLIQYQFSLQELLDYLFPHTQPCQDKDKDGICDKPESPSTTTTTIIIPDSERITASASILALSEGEYKSILGPEWKYFKKPYFMTAGEQSYGKYVQDIYDGSKVLVDNSNTSVTFSPKRRIRIYTEVYRAPALPIGSDVFDARGQEGWDEVNQNLYRKNHNPADPESLNVDYEMYYKNVNVLIVAENLEILYIDTLDKLALFQLDKIRNISARGGIY